MKILTIDFDILMHPSIDIYNDSEMTAEEYLNKFSFIGILEADLELYRDLTNLILSYEKDKIEFIYDHDDIVDLIEDIEEPIKLCNIDYHHDLGYGEDSSRLIIYHEGNWVKYLWEQKRLESYEWLKSYNSDPFEGNSSFITEEHFISNVNFDKELKDYDKVYISLSSPWVPSYYEPLYNLWEDLTKLK